MDQYIRQYGRRLYGLCRSLCRNVQDADDLYQDTWLKALDKLDSYDPGLPFEPWITRICVNTYRNVLRRLARSPVRPMEEGEDFPAPDSPDYAPLYEAVHGLPEKLRVTVVLYYFRDMDTAGTAEVLGVPQGTVKSRLSKARKLLKEVLEDASGSSF
ncbi:MAG: sigma-70 family RNA polymerase sigma factor [Oscillibacter sp.]|mgnify:CR=1 FL=1|nr:sigma-70 family RNA polymerase sigma factor [Oscillibacter sp.]